MLTRLSAALALLVLAAGCTPLAVFSTPPRVFKLTPAVDRQDGAPVGWQLLVETPLTSAMLNSTRIVLREEGGNLNYYSDAEWAEPLPEMIQGLMIESFENTGRIVAIGRETSGLRADYVLLTEIRDFYAEYQDGEPDKTAPTVRVRIRTKLVRMPRRTIEAGETFEATVRAGSPAMADIVQAYNTAFHDVARRAAEWALRPGQRPAGGR
ncbi:MAG TPA: ABC-type transport auxiliary lipoprotein family protein [Azospirillaceae bacterium]|nr:ABC-type transport auxiliary lipoprotein family protein [Azospirillaceae bacterium]